MTHNSISSRGFIKVNWFSQEAKIAWTELLYKKNVPLDGQTGRAKPSSQLFNLPGAWTLMKPLLKYSLHDCVYMWYSKFSVKQVCLPFLHVHVHVCGADLKIITCMPPSPSSICFVTVSHKGWMTFIYICTCRCIEKQVICTMFILVLWFFTG